MAIPVEIAAVIIAAVLGVLGYAIRSAHTTLEKHGLQLAKIETAMSMMGDAAARALHSPHTPELDFLLDKKIDGTITREDWIKLRDMCREIECDHQASKQERAFAGWVLVDCFLALNEPVKKMPHHE
jgi:hypothetical protein